MRWSQEPNIGKGRITFRSTQTCTVSEADDAEGTNEVFVGKFAGEATLHITKPYVCVATKGKWWWWDKAIDQTHHRTTDEVFTTLDRPEPLSPEMAALHAMVRRNEIERENMRQKLERLEFDTYRQHNAPREHRSGETEVSDVIETTEILQPVSSRSDEKPSESEGGPDPQISGSPPDGISE